MSGTRLRALRATPRGALLLGLVAWAACSASEPTRPSLAPAPEYVGVEVCAGCHARETRRWRGSHHDLAMQPASVGTVLGDFSAAPLEQGGERFHFHTRDGRFWVRAAGADGIPQEFEVLYCFGVEPLQQYLVPFPGGRLQALGVAWDARPASEGGQRWFHLHPEESVPPGDVLHWTGPAGSWNAQCADCHSTNVSQGYRPDGSYEPSWSETDVSCEACHGPGAGHVSWADAGADPAVSDRGLVVDLRGERAWRFADDEAIAHRVPPQASSNQLGSCAPCHARRSRIASGEPGGPFLDAYRPALLEEGLYHADGQILDEVYVWGSFLQSRMHGAGVVCSDCHDPHRLRIEEPDAVCAGCHRSEVFATAAHHHHPPGSPGSSCVACHMPERTYMVVDPRRDHSFRVPRPDLSARIGVPNACSGCHVEHPPAWAAEATARWYGTSRTTSPHYGEILDAGRRRAPGAAGALARLSADRSRPAIVRATALALLGRQLEPSAVPSLEAALRDPSDLVRLAAVGAAEALPARERWLALSPLLSDPRRAARIEAGRILAPWRRQVPEPGADIALAAALAEYRASQTLQADRPEAHVNLGNLHTELGELDEAERAYQTAIRLNPFFVPAYANLAELQRTRGRDDEGEQILHEGLARVPTSAPLHHALGLLLVRQQRGNEALEELAEATRLAPESPRFAYVYGVALHSAGRGQRARAVLAEAQRAHPGDADLLVALATLHREAGERDAALRYARLLLELRPQDPAARSLARELEEEPR